MFSSFPIKRLNVGTIDFLIFFFFLVWKIEKTKYEIIKTEKMLDKIKINLVIFHKKESLIRKLKILKLL